MSSRTALMKRLPQRKLLLRNNYFLQRIFQLRKNNYE